jgi:hypothetical protein
MRKRADAWPNTVLRSSSIRHAGAHTGGVATTRIGIGGIAEA